MGLNYFTAEDGTKTAWLRNWDNTQRRAILMHEDVDKILQENPAYATLGLKEEVQQGEQGEFTNVVIVAFKPADRTY